MSAHYSRICGDVYENDETGTQVNGNLGVLLPEIERLRAENAKLREALEALCVQGEHVVLGHFCRMPVIDGAVREMSVLIDAARAALKDAPDAG